MQIRHLRSSLLAVVAGTLASAAAAEVKYENETGGHVHLYGQFNPAFQSFDDGLTNTNTLVDNQHSNSRVGLWVVQPYGDTTVSFNFESSLGLRKSTRTNQNFTPDVINWDRTEIRKIDLKVATARAGTFYLGQGSMASDGAAHQDLSGTGLVLYNSIPDATAAFLFRPIGAGPTTRTVAAGFGSFDGGRLLRVRYDTPDLLPGLKVSASYGRDILVRNVDLETADASLFYARKVGSVEMRGAISYSVTDFQNGTKRHDTIGSFSALHDSGFNVTIAAGERRENGNYIYGKLGYRTQWFPVGKTSLAIDYYDGTDKTVVGSASSSFGIAAVQNFDDANVQAYLGYRTYSLSEPGVAFHDASSVMFGARWRF